MPFWPTVEAIKSRRYRSNPQASKSCLSSQIMELILTERKTRSSMTLYLKVSLQSLVFNIVLFLRLGSNQFPFGFRYTFIRTICVFAQNKYMQILSFLEL